MHNITSKLSSGSDHRRLREAAQYNQAMSCINHFLWATQTRWGEIKETCLEKHEMKQRDAESYQTNHENNTQKNVSFFAVNEYIKLKYSIEWTRCCRAISCACTTTVWLAVVSSGVNTHQQTWSCLFDLLVCRHHSKNVVNLLPAGQLILSVLLPPTGLGCVHHCYQKLS